MRCFENMAKLIRTKRQAHPKNYSQSELSHLLGYKNGQFISNMERALCNIPFKIIGRVMKILDIPPDEIRHALLEDQRRTIDNYLDKVQDSSEKKSKEPTKKDKDSYFQIES